jgi:hypothetical protein
MGQSRGNTWDATIEDYFPLKAAVITAMQDYIGYGYIACQVCHGHNACVRCMDDTTWLQLKKDHRSLETVYIGHQRWLSNKTDPWRKHGDLFNRKVELRAAP